MTTTTTTRILVSIALLCALSPTAALAQADTAAQDSTQHSTQQAAPPCPESRPCLPGEAERVDEAAAGYWLGHPASLSPLAHAADTEQPALAVALPAALAGLALIVGFLRSRKRSAQPSAVAAR